MFRVEGLEWLLQFSDCNTFAADQKHIHANKALESVKEKPF